jgi:hypothetical protein
MSVVVQNGEILRNGCNNCRTVSLIHNQLASWKSLFL